MSENLTLHRESTSSGDTITIKDLAELAREISIWEGEYKLEKLPHPIQVTREALDKLKQEIQSTEERERETTINRFIQEKVHTQSQLNELWVWDIDVNNPLDSVWSILTATTSEVTDAFKEAQGKEGIWKIDSLFKAFDKLWGVWDKIVMWFSALVWKVAPSLAKFLNIENPTEKIAKQAAEAAQSEAQEKKDQVQEALSQAREQVKPGYKTYAKVFFTIFSPSHELANANWLNRDLEKNISQDLFNLNAFPDLTYHQLSDPNTPRVLANQLIEQNKNLYNEFDSEILKRHIRFVLLGITGGQESYQTKSWYSWLPFTTPKENSQEITSGHDFLVAMYQKDGEDIQVKNPTVKEIFEKIHGLKDFVGFEFWNFDPGAMLSSLWGNLNNFIQNESDNIMKLGDDAFTEMKEDLPHSLRNFTDFQILSSACLRSHHSRTLENKFSLADNSSDSVNESPNQERLTEFIWDDQTWLIKFGNEIYENVFQAWDPIKWLESVKKSDLSLRSIYRLYIATGWESNISSLGPIKKLQLTALLIWEFSGAEGLGQKVWSIFRFDRNTEIKLSDDVKNLLMAIGRTAKNIAKEAIKQAGAFLWWLTKENPLLAAWILIIMYKYPILPNRKSLSQLWK